MTFYLDENVLDDEHSRQQPCEACKDCRSWE